MFICPPGEANLIYQFFLSLTTSKEIHTKAAGQLCLHHAAVFRHISVKREQLRSTT